LKTAAALFSAEKPDKSGFSEIAILSNQGFMRNNQRSDSKSPSLSTCSYSSSDITEKTNVLSEEEMRSEEEQFFSEISKNEEESFERQQQYLKESGLVKRLIDFNQIR
jgi:hypothetical protein